MPAVLKPKNRLFYGWVIVSAFSIIGTIQWGIRFSYGVFFKSIEGEFELTRAATSTVVSAYMIFGAMFVVLAGWAVDRYGPRILVLLMGIITGISLLLTSQTNSLWQLFITYSLLLAMGTSSVYLVIISTVTRWFDKKRGMALGISSIGSGLGTVLMAPFATYVISHFTWRMAYLAIGLVAWLFVIPLSRLLKKEPNEIGAVPDGAGSVPMDKHLQELTNEGDNVSSTDLSVSQALRTRSLWLFISIYFLFSFSQLLVLTHIVPHVTDIGFPAVEAAAVLSLIGAGNIAGRVLMGIASDRIGRKLTVIICTLLHAGTTVWLLWLHELWLFYIFALVYGFAYGGRGPIIGSLVGDTFGLSKMGAILGMIEMGFNVGAATGPAIGGLIFDISQSYSMAFVLAAATMLVVALLVALVRKETHQGFSSPYG
ncbi:MFS transporter [Chloroflexota bacterium]